LTTAFSGAFNVCQSFPDAAMEIVCLPPMKKFRPPIDLKAIEITTGSGTNAEAYTDLTRCDHILNERTVLATTKGIANAYIP